MARFQHRIFALAARLTGSVPDAQEVTQDAFLRLHDHRRKLHDEASIQAWLRTVTLNLCRDRARRRASASPCELPDIASGARSPERQASESQREQLLKDALQQLSERERTALTLRELEGLTTQEVAVQMQIAEATVRVYVMNARLKLREILAHAARGTL
ncbi:MAG: sigma-70 family RNA polymerase sigma factor [Acidobacteria bacterium]|nr:sigma-70 family RNA polymerase sigma factor [Acidobacteriota bacterium]